MLFICKYHPHLIVQSWFKIGKVSFFVPIPVSDRGTDYLCCFCRVLRYLSETQSHVRCQTEHSQDY